MIEAGFREIAHTADWELQVWAPDMPSLLETAARGMYSLAGVRLREDLPVECRLELSAKEPERLLVKFLAELLFFAEQENLAFNRFSLEIHENTLHACLYGFPLAGINKEIKAVTYHNLAVHRTDRGLEANVVFDV